jgi:hypothetical protein
MNEQCEHTGMTGAQVGSEFQRGWRGGTRRATPHATIPCTRGDVGGGRDDCQTHACDVAFPSGAFLVPCGSRLPPSPRATPPIPNWAPAPIKADKTRSGPDRIESPRSQTSSSVLSRTHIGADRESVSVSDTHGNLIQSSRHATLRRPLLSRISSWPIAGYLREL